MVGGELISSFTMILNVSHYSFFNIQDPGAARLDLMRRFEKMRVVGTVLLAPEGVNLNLASEDQSFKTELESWLASIGCTKFDFKLSYSSALTFKRLKIKVKKEIITMGVENLDVHAKAAPHISPAEFKELLVSGDKSTLILDTRNDFEVGYGTFQGAQPAGMRSFRDFTQVAEKLPKDKKIVMFCTGGVRCEKASAYLRDKGFSEVRQLEGGILRYLESQGFEGFNGGCFVFDERVVLSENS